jgi:phosphoadenosine phosphosulfate reductase
MERDKATLQHLNIGDKVSVSKEVVRKALTQFSPERMAIAITGGKDSTANLWICKNVCDEMGVNLPRCMFIDEGDVFDEIVEFVQNIKELWSLEIAYLKNNDVSSKAHTVGDIIKVSSLNDANQAALQETGFTDPEFSFMPDSTVCNHLLKTVPMREFIIHNDIHALFIAIRWDEQVARQDEDFFSVRTGPDHTRVHPILHFSERDIWIATFTYDIPFNKLYQLGYRSLGARCATSRNSDIPAWMQDLEHTSERGGRGQDKEKIMDRLRSLGYM